MHEPIQQFPKGRVLGSCRLSKDRHVIDVTRIKLGSATRFVESVTHEGRYGAVRTALRASDEFPSDKSANRFISSWLEGAVQNQRYRVLHKDDGFESYEQQVDGAAQ